MNKIEATESRPGPGNTGFAVLCPARNLGGFMTTVRTLKGVAPGSKCIGILPEDATDAEMADFRKHCPVYRGGGSVPSLANLAFEKSESEWTMTLMAGTVARPGLLRLYERFGQGGKDVLYAVERGTWRFEESGFNGLAMRGSTFCGVGPFADIEKTDLSKLFWAMDAATAGCRINGLVGVAL